jgi:hypothetical protein
MSGGKASLSNIPCHRGSAFHDWKSPCNDGSVCGYDEATGLEYLHVNTIQSFIQAIGYLKFIFADNNIKIVYRGQTDLYGSKSKKRREDSYLFQPSALRGVTCCAALNNAKHKIKEQISAIRKAIPRFADTNKYGDGVIEGLLQQYGVKTTWIDAVDNIWVALWFACFRSNNPVEVVEMGDVKRSYIHMIRRDPDTEHDRKHFAYILLLGVDENEDEILDLRCKLPSDFIRPHVQHGLLVRTKGVLSANMVRLLKGVIRIKLSDALKWLGHGAILMPDRIVPPPNYDSGFRQLLEGEFKCDKQHLFTFPIYC